MFAGNPQKLGQPGCCLKRTMAGKKGNRPPETRAEMGFGFSLWLCLKPNKRGNLKQKEQMHLAFRFSTTGLVLSPVVWKCFGVSHSQNLGFTSNQSKTTDMGLAETRWCPIPRFITCPKSTASLCDCYVPSPKEARDIGLA